MRAFRGMLPLYLTELHILTNKPMDVPHNPNELPFVLMMSVTAKVRGDEHHQ